MESKKVGTTCSKGKHLLPKHVGIALTKNTEAFAEAGDKGGFVNPLLIELRKMLHLHMF